MAWFNLIMAALCSLAFIFNFVTYIYFKSSWPVARQRRRNLIYGSITAFVLFAMSVNIWLFVTNPS